MRTNGELTVEYLVSQVQNHGVIVTESQMDSRVVHTKEIKNEEVAKYLVNHGLRKTSEVVMDILDLLSNFNKDGGNDYAIKLICTRYNMDRKRYIGDTYENLESNR